MEEPYKTTVFGNFEVVFEEASPGNVKVTKTKSGESFFLSKQAMINYVVDKMIRPYVELKFKEELVKMHYMSSEKLINHLIDCKVNNLKGL